MSQLFYTSEHEWIAVDGEIGTIGITDHAQHLLGDVVFVELPGLGRRLGKGEEAAVVESVKAASDVFAPVSGEVVAVNDALLDQPGLVNLSAEGGAWFFKLRLTDGAELDSLYDRTGYESFLASQE